MALSLEALTQFVAAHNTALADHDQWLTRQQDTLERTNATLAETNATLAQTNQILTATAAQQQINTQEIADLRAGMVTLQNLVADYLRGRSQT